MIGKFKCDFGELTLTSVLLTDVNLAPALPHAAIVQNKIPFVWNCYDKPSQYNHTNPNIPEYVFFICFTICDKQFENVIATSVII